MSYEETATATTAPPRGVLARTSLYRELERRITRRLPPSLTGQLLRFGVVGVTNTALSWCLFALAVKVLGVWYPAASAGAFAAGAINGYTLNRVWTFRAGRFRASGFMRYLAVQAIGLGLNELLLVALVEGLRVTNLVAQIIALLFVSASTFMLNRQWAFAAPAEAPSTPAQPAD